MATSVPGTSGAGSPWMGDERTDWVPPNIDATKPSSARIYDYFLGGKDNYAIDRAAAEEMLKSAPDARKTARSNRTFLVKAVQLMTQAGIEQFIDLGTGIPTSPNVHEVAGETTPEARVVYVDIDPIVTSHARALLATLPTVVSVQQDLRQPAAILQDPAVRSLIDFSRPVGLLLVGVLHFVSFDVGTGMVRTYLNALAPGSHLALSAASREGMAPEAVRRMEEVGATLASGAFMRSMAQVEELFEGLDLVEPGITEVSRWRSDGTPGRLRILAGVGVKR